ncbi:DUF5592 family protein [Bacillus subtilis]|uniref:DUF5592 family protein n=1 Tax=Bacillus subtilis TaxID=1423 RepID=UPI00084A18E9|nr:DUF5592 family protein [Bacillus subtilis]ODV48161.1 hypothetical protein BCM26_04230 [Bacillus subtilis]OJH64118.1 hypothetical protein BOH71_07225 [Bacillus subtilis]
MSYPIPKEVKTDIKVKGPLYLRDVGILIGVTVLSQIFKGSVHSSFIIPYYIFIYGVTFFLMIPSINNPKKRNFHSIFFALKRSRNTYHPISRSSLDNVDEFYGQMAETEKASQEVQKNAV